MTTFHGRQPGARNLTDEERSVILHLAKDLNRSVNQIAKEIGRSRTAVVQVLSAFKGTQHLARAHFDVEAYHLAKRAVDNADVDQTLEILDRTGVLEKKRDPKAGSGGPSVVVCVGMPNSPAVTPPAQIFVTRALTAASDAKAEDAK